MGSSSADGALSATLSKGQKHLGDLCERVMHVAF